MIKNILIVIFAFLLGGINTAIVIKLTEKFLSRYVDMIEVLILIVIVDIIFWIGWLLILSKLFLGG